MIYHPISQYLEHTDLMSDAIKAIMGERFYGIETNPDGQFMLLSDDTTLAEKDALDALEYPTKKILKINSLIRRSPDPYDVPYDVPVDVDFVSGLKVKLHRKSIIVKGELQAEEYYLNYSNGVYSDLIVKEITTFTRDALGFPLYKDVEVKWTCEDGSFHPITKTWRTFYSLLQKIQEGKTRRGNLFDNLQMPCIGLISYALLGHTNGSPEVILEGRRFLADYAIEFKLFVDDSNKTILDCLNDDEHPRYITSQAYSWIDSMTPYGITIRQFIASELTI